jgi:hypothetical protein
MKPTSLRFHPGARLGWSAARIRAHELSAPKRKAVKPVHGGTVGTVFAECHNASARLNGERVCDCGTIVCSKRGPCAPPPAPSPKAPDVPAVDGKAWVFAAGMQVRFTEVASWMIGSLKIELGREYTVDHVDRDGDVWVAGDDGHLVCTGPHRLEPIPSPADEREGWRPEACGWRKGERSERWFHYSGAQAFESLEPGMWLGRTPAGLHSERLPSVALACCAALSIDVYNVEGDEWRACMKSGEGGVLVHGCVSAEACARAALNAHAKAGGR